ncbi:MAG: co-chaperone GroES [Candidatus Kerfeldbacteria bacterium]|nr:co-chaperone GroES [Candidatus Kerfeldbacteria bacterium]
MNLRPLSDHVLVKPTQEDKMTKSGIVLPDTAEDDKGLKQGEVLAVGPGKLLDNGQRAPMSVKVGDRVIMKKYGPDEVKIEGVEYLVAEESDIIGIV